MKPENLRASPVKFYACSVNLVTGETVYASQGYSGILDKVKLRENEREQFS